MTSPTPSPRARGNSQGSERQGSFGSDLIAFLRQAGVVALASYAVGIALFLVLYGLQVAGVFG